MPIAVAGKGNRIILIGSDYSGSTALAKTLRLPYAHGYHISEQNWPLSRRKWQ